MNAVINPEVKRYPVKALHQIEMTSRCNLACKYCVHKKMPRPKLDMDHETYVKALSVAKRFVDNGTQHELNLAGIGESTMHPRFIEYVHLAREAVGFGCRLVLSTNGVELTRDMVRDIASTKIMVWVSPHRPEKAAKAINYLREFGLFMDMSAGSFMASIDWAGQVDWPVTAGTTGTPCPWLPNGRVSIMADGRATACCMDSDGSGVVCHLDDLVAGSTEYTRGYRLCGACHHSTEGMM